MELIRLKDFIEQLGAEDQERLVKKATIVFSDSDRVIARGLDVRPSASLKRSNDLNDLKEKGKEKEKEPK